MMPPINLDIIIRPTATKDTHRKLYLLSEGTLTEPSFLEAIITRSPYMASNDEVGFYKVARSGKEHGINKLQGMVNIAYESVVNNKETKFRKKKDKVIIFFDLDIYRDRLEEVKRIINDNKKYIIFVFTNPAVELFLLLCKENAYETIVEPNREAILENNWVEGTDRRYIHHLVVEKMGVDPKDSEADFDVFANGLQNAIQQEKIYLSKKLTQLDKNLISNFGMVLERIKENDFDDIDYSIL